MEIISRKNAKQAGLKFFFTGNSCSKGHVSKRYISGSCFECKKEYREENKIKLADWQRQYRKENPGLVSQQKRETYKKDREKILRQKAEYYESNKNRIKAVRKEYYKNNKELSLSCAKRWRDKNPLNTFVRTTLRRLEIYGDPSSAEESLGYSKSDFLLHIEKQFARGMAWENRTEWHIDHITPVSWFLSEGITDIKVINCLSNLRPVWAKENLSKSSKVEFLL